MIYTSNFSIIKKLSDNLTIPVSISRNSPDWYDGLEYKKLSPSSDLLYEWKKNKDIIKYIKRYKSEVLDKLSINEVISDLLTLTNNKKGLKYAPNFILVCYEPIPPKDMSYKEIINSEKYFCHRHLVAKWFNLSGIDKFQYVEVKEF